VSESPQKCSACRSRYHVRRRSFVRKFMAEVLCSACWLEARADACGEPEAGRLRYRAKLAREAAWLRGLS